VADSPEDRGLRKLDHERIHEATRLCGFGRETYGGARLTQEQIGESLKRTRAALLTRGLRNTLHNFLPSPFGPRVAHVRVPEPILVDRERAAHDDGYVAELVVGLRQMMQASVGEVGRVQDTEKPGLAPGLPVSLPSVVFPVLRPISNRSN
jgi:hypothetical protein